MLHRFFLKNHHVSTVKDMASAVQYNKVGYAVFHNIL